MYFMPYVNSANSRLQKNNNNTNKKKKKKKKCSFASMPANLLNAAESQYGIKLQ